MELVPRYQKGGGEYLRSSIFDHISGFGGNGAKISLKTETSSPSLYAHSPNSGGCIIDGPFKSRNIRIGPYGKMERNNTRCLRRDLNHLAVESSATKKILS
jgi:hypothetical protein